MGSLIEINDTLQLTRRQGFPEELEIERHRVKLFTADDFKETLFEFKDKKNIRVYHVPPVRNFLVHNIDGKWLYWGLIHIVELRHDYASTCTSGKFRIQYIYTPDEMESAHQMLDRNKQTDFFNTK